MINQTDYNLFKKRGRLEAPEELFRAIERKLASRKKRRLLMRSMLLITVSVFFALAYLKTTTDQYYAVDPLADAVNFFNNPDDGFIVSSIFESIRDE